MTRFGKVITEKREELKKILIKCQCPSEFGIENPKYCDISNALTWDCETCWNEETESNIPETYQNREEEKMENKDWLKLIREKEDEIMKGLEKIYLQAAHNHDEYFDRFKRKVTNSLILDADGVIRITETIVPNSIDYCVLNNISIYIARIEDFSLWDNEDEEEWIRDKLEERYADFERYLEEDCECPTLDELKKYDPKAYRSILNDMTWWVENVDAPDWAQESYHEATLILKEDRGSG
jgi:uncharacterized membrane-anchored protein YjiN (DUF445 family)